MWTPGWKVATLVLTNRDPYKMNKLDALWNCWYTLNTEVLILTLCYFSSILPEASEKGQYYLQTSLGNVGTVSERNPFPSSDTE